MLQIPESSFETEQLKPMAKIRAAVARVDRLLLVTVVLPTLIAIVYFGFLASDIYISESRFVVRSPDKPASTGLGILLKSTGFSKAGDEVYAAEEYIKSRDALKALNEHGAVARAYGNNDISIFDRFNPLGLSGAFEDLYRYYRGKVGVGYDSTTSVTSLSVSAFNPEDAYRMNRQLLQLAEGVVNRLNDRGREDLVEFAEREVHDAEIADRDAAIALAGFRNASGVVDPEAQASAQLQMVSKLQDELIGARMQLLQLQKIAPENPQVPILKTRIAGLAREVDVQMGRAAGNRRSLSATAVQYQRLQLEKEFADRRLAAAMTSLQESQTEARRKQAYIERVAQPNLPDEASGPGRLRGIISTFVVGLLAWGILKLLFAGVREHHG